jgi:hypothetical protein
MVHHEKMIKKQAISYHLMVKKSAFTLLTLFQILKKSNVKKVKNAFTFLTFFQILKMSNVKNLNLSAAQHSIDLDFWHLHFHC